MAAKDNSPVTLADKLKSTKGRQRFSFLWIVLISSVIGILLWWALSAPLLGLEAAIFCAVFLLILGFRKRRKTNFLISNDKHGFMGNLKLSDKTAIFDGSNIYHFGHDNELDAQPLGLIVHQLRAEGYRIVCFFDANIYHRLCEHGAFPTDQQHSVPLLVDIFGLRRDEIYVVPSGVQADLYVVETLSLLPISFAVTNDRFRDYEANYDFLAKDRSWRKGVTIKNGNLLLYQHSFKSPLVM